MKSLQEFYNDKETMNNVHEYLVEFFKQEAVRALFEKKVNLFVNPETIADAKELVDKAFDNLDVMFNPKPKKLSLDNEAR